MERKLNAYVLRTLIPSMQIRNSKLVNTAVNLKKINKATGLKRFMHTVVDAAMYDYYDNKLMSASLADMYGYYHFDAIMIIRVF